MFYRANKKPGPAEESEKKYVVNLRLMKLMGLYQILNPNTAKVCGNNPFRVAGTAATLYLSAMYALCASSLYSSLTHSAGAVVNSALMFLITSFTLIKLYFIFRHADALWQFVGFSSVDFLTYGGHRRDALAAARTVSVAVTYAFALLWGTVSTSSALSPILRPAESDGRYRGNVLNFVYPVSDELYNDNFAVFYSIETTALACYVYTMVVYDCLVISAAVVVAFQLKTIASSYSDLGHAADRAATADDTESNDNALQTFYFIRILRDSAFTGGGRSRGSGNDPPPRFRV